MTMQLTKNEIRTAITRLMSLYPPGPRPLGAAELVEVTSLVEKLRAIGEAQANAVERGRLVLSWRIPHALIPTQNELGHKRHWEKKKLNAALDDALIRLLPSFPDAPTNGATLKRWVRATRFTSAKTDSDEPDAIGFKLAIDCLTRRGVIANDDKKHIHREGRVEKCKPGDAHGLIEVFLIATEQVAAPDPAFVKVAQVVHEPGLFTKMLKTGGVK